MTAPVEPRRRGQAGVVGGSDGLLFGMLVLVTGSLVLVNVWAVIDTRAALDAAAREYLRSYTEQPEPASAAHHGDLAARAVLAGRMTPISDLRIEAPGATHFGPCAIATVKLSADIPTARLPFIDDIGRRTVTVQHAEMIDPHREVTPGAHWNIDDTACAD